MEAQTESAVKRAIVVVVATALIAVAIRTISKGK
jgi:hypothetical protein